MVFKRHAEQSQEAQFQICQLTVQLQDIQTLKLQVAPPFPWGIPPRAHANAACSVAIVQIQFCDVKQIPTKIGQAGINGEPACMMVKSD